MKNDMKWMYRKIKMCGWGLMSFEMKIDVNGFLSWIKRWFYLVNFFEKKFCSFNAYFEFKYRKLENHKNSFSWMQVWHYFPSFTNFEAQKLVKNLLNFTNILKCIFFNLDIFLFLTHFILGVKLAQQMPMMG